LHPKAGIFQLLTTDIDCIPASVEMIGMERFSWESLQNVRFDIGPKFDGNPNESDESGVHSHQNSQRGI
jgi:hypothetical protein